MTVEFPERPLVQFDLPDNDWKDAMRWARATPTGTHWLVHPGHTYLYGSSIRIASEPRRVSRGGQGRRRRDVRSPGRRARTRARQCHWRLQHARRAPGAGTGCALRSGLSGDRIAKSGPSGRVFQRAVRHLPSADEHSGLHSEAPPDERPHDDVVRVGKASAVSAIAGANATLLRRCSTRSRPRQSARALLLAAGAPRRADAARASWPGRVELGALHARPCRQSLECRGSTSSS